MNDYRPRFGLNRPFESSTTSMGKFFSTRLRDSLVLGADERENFDQTTADYEATPEPPPISLYDINRSIITPSSTSSRHDTYFTPTTPDTHKFSRRVELSSGYNILKNRTSSRPTRLPAYLQGRTPLAQLNPLPSTILPTNSNSEENFQRRLSFTDYNRTQQFHFDGTRRPFSSDSPLPPPLLNPATTTTTYISSAPLVHTRTAYEPIEPLKLASEQENNSIAALSRELRAAAYPTTRKSSNHSPVRETSPSTTKYSTRLNTKRNPPRSLPKIHTNDQQNMKSTHFYHHHESEKSQASSTHTDDCLQNSSTGSLLLDQFFNSDSISHGIIEKHEHTPSSTLLTRTTSLPNTTDDTSISFVSKYARLAPIVSSQNSTLDTLHDLSIPITDDLLPTSDIANLDSTTNDFDETYSYVPLKEQLNSIDGIPLLELDELETSSDISESQLVPIIYAKDLANEIDLLQKAHLLKQQQRSISMTNENGRLIDNNSIPPPDNMELLNFEALEEEFSIYRSQNPTPIPSPVMEISSSPAPAPTPPPPPPPEPPSVSENEASLTSVLQHSILSHNRSSPWYKLPTELWFKILPYLNTHDLHNFSYVCKRFYFLVQDRACQHKIIFNRRMNFQQLWFDILSRRKPISITFNECRQQNLENLQIQSIEDIHWFEFFQSINSTLLHFTMSGCYHEPFTPNTLLPIVLQTSSNLLTIHLRWNSITESTLNHLISYSQIINLHTLDLTGCQVLNDTILINIFLRDEKEFALKKLILEACMNLTWISLDTIASYLPNLTHLNVSRCVGLKNHSSNQTPTCFQYWPKLQSIDLSYLLNLTDQDLISIFDYCPQLNELILDECMNLSEQIFSRLTNRIEILSLNNCKNLSRNFLLNLNEQCPNMRMIFLNSIENFNENCLSKWSEKPWKHLQMLSIDKYTVDILIVFLEKHSNLKTLSLNGNLISQKIEQENLQMKFSNIHIVFQ